MKYTHFFSLMIKTQGIPQLGVDQFQRLMNIVYLEGRISSYSLIETDHKRLFLRKFRMEKQLTDLTGNQHPNNLIQEMITLSENHFRNNH